MSAHWCFGSLLLVAGIAFVACGIYLDKNITREEYMRMIGGALCVISEWVVLLGTVRQSTQQHVALAVPIQDDHGRQRV